MFRNIFRRRWAPLPLEERYRDRDDYAGRIRNAAVALEHDGYLLPEDVLRIGEQANGATW